MRTRRITEVRADRGVLEDRRSPPGSMRRTAIASIENETQLESKYVENVTTVLGHRSPLIGTQDARAGSLGPYIESLRNVIVVTNSQRHLSHHHWNCLDTRGIPKRST